MKEPLPSGRSFHDVVMVPYADLLDRWRDGQIHRGGPIWPAWDEQVAARHRRGGRPVDVRPADPPGPVEDAGPMAWGGAIVDAFGHQVADFSMRLLATTLARPELPVAFASRPDLGYDRLDAVPGYVREILGWFGVPPEDVRLITVPTRVPELFVVPQAEQLSGPGPSALYLDTLDELAERRLGPLDRDGRLLYVSRAGMEARFAGEPYLEDALRRAGVRVMRPETIPLAEQLRNYREADDVVVAEGSALHALQLLGHVDASLTVLQRRPGSRLAEENLLPRVSSLTYLDVSRAIVHGLLPTGRPALPKGLSVAHSEQLLATFAVCGVDLRREWDLGAWSEARDTDVLRWVDTQASEPGHLANGSVERILDGLAEAGLGHLLDAAAERLGPLRTHLASVPPLRTAEHPTLLFMHIPRSGGGAACAALREAFPAPERAEVRAGSELDRAAFAALPEERRASLAVVTGDFGFGFHEHIPRVARYAVMLRHPVGRILSLYRAAGRPGPSIESWVFEDRRLAADNAMVRAISGRPNVPFGECTDDMLDEAVANIEAHFDAVLSRSSMSRSAVVLGRALGVTLPPFAVVNADPEGEDSFDPPAEVRKRLRQLNRLDVALFRRYSEDF